VLRLSAIKIRDGEDGENPAGETKTCRFIAKHFAPIHAGGHKTK